MGPTRDDQPIEVLVVDDEPDVQSLFELRFRREIRDGALALHFAGSGNDALDVVRSHPSIEVVVTDLNMPGMSGLELLGRLAELARPIKTIVLTAYGDLANIRTAMMRGAFDFQVKPLDIDDLRVTIRKASSIVRELRAGEEAARRARELELRNLHLTEVFGRYVSDEVVAQLLRSADGAELASELRDVTVLLADIRGFSRLSRELEPHQVVRVLNGYLDVAIDRVLAHGGLVNEVLGDGVLALFGVPIADPDAARHAVAAALELQLAMGDLNERHRAEHLPELAVGVAVHSGEAVVGTIGTGRRLKYTAVGPTINLAARLESCARGGQVLVSEATYRRVRDLVSVSGRFELQAEGADRVEQVHVVRGLGGPHLLELPQTVEPMHAPPRKIAARVARVVDGRLGREAPCEVVAIGRASARVRTDAVLAPLDDVVLRLEEVELYGRVSESSVSSDGRHVLTVVYHAVAGTALERVLARSTGGAAAERGAGRLEGGEVRRTARARADR